MTSRYLNLILRSEEIQQDLDEGRITLETATGRENDLEKEWNEYWDGEDSQ